MTQRPPSLSRRQLLGFGLGTAAAGLLAGCAVPGSTNVNRAALVPTAASGETVQLTYWAWLKDLQKVCDVWNAQNPRIQVTANWIPGGNTGGYQKMYSALAAGGGPDIGQVELRQIPEFMLANGLVDLARYGAKDHQAKYDDAAWAQVSFLDGVYGIPQDTGPMGFYYQTALLEQAGGEPPATWDAWRDLADKVRSTGRRNYLEVFPVADASPFAAYVQQAGARWFRTDGDEWVVDMTDDTTMMVAEFFDGVIDDDLVDTSAGAFTPGWYASAASGGVAAVTSASWADALIQSVQGGEGKWQVAPMQTWGDTGSGSSAIGGSTAAVLANAQHPAEALEFITWMTTSKEGIDAMIEYCGIGWSPAKDYIGQAREEPSEWFSGQRYNEEVFVPAAQEQNIDWSWSPVTQSAFTSLQNQFRRKLTGGLKLPDAVELAQREIVQSFRDKGLGVRTAR
ncbi:MULTISPECIES: ABC transporter substrate-binding protein [unclassified Curtobacterium]|uniref:ABC transporter substrate-binding protein n=1 Tax=unclassified Curtobacterium TaxID=257496 RepID=UPI0008DDA94D|nr:MULTISPECIES: extracellular solute-binding protein [unclassified Curtobacterium]OIH95817.1 ABC transporter substrate-binding protein [Curtobacterium sp. MCBA15_003]OII33566.1 ABC transporter substrate-binding protein [Curtobacterium sp. MMLR14_006]